MAGGVGDFISKKHQKHGGNENDAPATQPELAQRQAAKGLKFQGAGFGGPSIYGSAVPSRGPITGPARTGSPITMQQAGAQNGFPPQNRTQINGQGQGYPPKGHLWEDSTLDSDSTDTVRDKLFNHYNNGNGNHEVEEAHGQHFEGHHQDIGSSERQSDSDPEEEEFDQNNVQYNQNYNAYPMQPGINQVNIPLRGHSGRFVVEPRVRQQQPPVMETVLSNGAGQNYGQKNIPERLGHQVRDADTFAPSEVDEDTIHSVVGNGGRNSKRQAEDMSDIDFDKETLYNMRYEELKKQPFEEDPNQPKQPPTPSVEGGPKPLGERMELFKTQPTEERAAFLAALSIDEWEDAGDWLMSQFGTVMNQVADARRQRRRIAARFEEKLAARDAVVNEKATAVAVALKDLKSGGQNLLRGTTPT